MTRTQTWAYLTIVYTVLCLAASLLFEPVFMLWAWLVIAISMAQVLATDWLLSGIGWNPLVPLGLCFVAVAIGLFATTEREVIDFAGAIVRCAAMSIAFFDYHRPRSHSSIG